MFNLFWYSVGLVIGFVLFSIVPSIYAIRADRERTRRQIIEALKETDVYPGKVVHAYCMCEKCANHRFVSGCALSQIEVNSSGRCEYFVKRKKGDGK
mgnify:CR=1 FL=1